MADAASALIRRSLASAAAAAAAIMRARSESRRAALSRHSRTHPSWGKQKTEDLCPSDSDLTSWRPHIRGSPFAPQRCAFTSTQSHRKHASHAVEMKLNPSFALVIGTCCTTVTGCHCFSSVGINTEATKACCREAGQEPSGHECMFGIGYGDEIFSNCCRSYGCRMDCRCPIGCD